MVIPTFRQNFPEFSDTAVYPDSMITFWAGIAELQVRQCVWKNMYSNGVQLYVAHELTMAAGNVKSAASGGTPGLSGGIANSKTVGSVSVGYDSNATAERDAGWWNMSNYGKQFIRLARLFGAGAIQL